MNKHFLLIGDFNGHMYASEKASCSNSGTLTIDMLLAMNEIGAIDLGATGNLFTWSNGRNGNENVKVKLDRALAYHYWRILFPKATLTVLPAIQSDHNPILLKTDEEHEQG
ncbi:RNA-directed DNA polymerase (Reverse transcriptase) Ribonuclease H [Quillaja saponaria]|uniref:RNA-directed DNA polymerase (Reverse transcriptase) Ribonuclease H n=1 Tax=Quillaja saponaria TaxID=32244 RepID=A0AAD7PEF7_QUISA|nr:RNA-directed DNA polymerase (Reverse transcriptase) Ribonuclease H [Quillaja saponaria]